ncbi:MAG: LTA synthase family protein [Bacteroidaceae bacterium]|nr:LTA synthase family protein [Bacteroidaceae bacterium]
MNIRRGAYSNALALVCNLLLVYVVYALCRIEFVLENWQTFSNTLFQNHWTDLLKGSWRFDTSAILYTNALYALLMLLPIPWAESKVWRNVAKWVFIVVNAVCVVVNVADSVYFQYTGRRTTLSVLNEFSHENNLGGIFLTEFIRHGYLVLFALLMWALLYLLYCHPCSKTRLTDWRRHVAYYLITITCFLFYIPLTICGMRGGATTAVRPITISNANQYVNHPIEAAVVLNTPFSLIRTFNKTTFVNPEYFTNEELNSLYSPVHHNQTTGSPCKKNVVILIIESFGREYIGTYNEGLEDGKYRGYTPFIDSLYRHCLSFDYTFANGRKSIDGMPSILSSIPMFVEPFFLTPASLNDVSGLAGELGKASYQSAFFHGAENGSMGFQAFARTTGFQHYYGRTEYNEDKRFGGDRDFDGTWAIWDEPFLQFYALKMTEMQEPFATALFTASSHHPYTVPEAYKDMFPEEGNNPIHKCIRYTDMALRKFFDTAQRQPWFQNTLFVLTSDHTNWSDHPEYQTDLGLFGAPILFYDPSGTLPAERRHAIAQQIDIMPTVLSYLKYDKPYIAFGCDLLTTPDSATWAVNYLNGIYQYVEGDYVLQFDGEKSTALYHIKEDWLMRHNLIADDGLQAIKAKMERRVKAIIQSYMQRMNENRLTIQQEN